MTKMMYVVLLLCASSLNVFARNPGSWCKDVLVSFEASQLPIRVQEISFGSEENESFARLTVFNNEAKAIRDYLIVVEFLDKDGKFLLTVPFYTNDPETGETPFPVSYKRWLYGHSNSAVSPLPPMAEKSFFGDSPTVALTCPAAARLAAVQLQYTDGTSFSHNLSGLTLDPVITLAPISDAKIREWLPQFLTLRLDVEANGSIQLVHPEDNPLLNLLAKEVQTWKVVPAHVDGKRVAGEFIVFMYLEDVGQDGAQTRPPPECISEMSLLRGQGIRAVTMVHAYRRSPAAKTWIVKAGHQWVEKLDERQR